MAIPLTLLDIISKPRPQNMHAILYIIYIYVINVSVIVTLILTLSIIATKIVNSSQK